MSPLRNIVGESDLTRAETHLHLACLKRRAHVPATGWRLLMHENAKPLLQTNSKEVRNERWPLGLLLADQRTQGLFVQATVLDSWRPT